MLFLLLVRSFIASGQIAPIDILSSQFSENELSVLDARKDFLEENKFNSPWFRELDFRVRSNDTEVDLEDYRLRLGLLNPKEIKANRKYYQLLLDQQSLERKKLINDILLRRYELLIEHFYLSNTLTINAGYVLELQQLRDLVINETSDIAEVVDLEMEITKLELRNTNLRQQSEIVQLGLGIAENQLLKWNNDDVVNPLDVNNIISLNTGDNRPLGVLEVEQELEREETILSIKKAEAFSNLGYLQAEYDSDRGNDFERHFGFQIGIQIPVFNRDRPNIQRRQLEIVEDRAKLEMIKQEELVRFSEYKSNIKHLADQYTVVEKSFSKLDTLKALTAQNGATIKSYSALAEYDYFLLSRGITLQSNLLRQYVQLLHLQGILSDEPYVNYLSSGLENFSIQDN